MRGATEAELERELEKAEQTIAMADRALQISRLEQERLSSELAEQVEQNGPAGEEA